MDSRTAEDGSSVRRRRQCSDCSHRFTTYERCDERPLVVVKRSGARAPFEFAKLAGGIRSAAKGRPLADRIDEVAAEIVESLPTRGGEVTTEAIGLTILERLRALDPVAYVRFASVYKGFEDPADFEREVGLLTKASPPKPSPSGAR